MLLSTPELRRWDAYWMLIVLVGKLAWNIEFWRKEACCFLRLIRGIIHLGGSQSL
jgi:hypothetical protein